MTMRMLLVAVSTAAILAGSSYGALARGHSEDISKGSSESGVKVVSTAEPTTGRDTAVSTVTINAWGNADATAPNGGGAGATYKSGGGGLAVEAAVTSDGSSGKGSLAAAQGGASGSACAGSGCH